MIAGLGMLGYTAGAPASPSTHTVAYICHGPTPTSALECVYPASFGVLRTPTRSMQLARPAERIVYLAAYVLRQPWSMTVYPFRTVRGRSPGAYGHHMSWNTQMVRGLFSKTVRNREDPNA